MQDFILETGSHGVAVLRLPDENSAIRTGVLKIFSLKPRRRIPTVHQSFPKHHLTYQWRDYPAASQTNSKQKLEDKQSLLSLSKETETGRFLCVFSEWSWRLFPIGIFPHEAFVSCSLLGFEVINKGGGALKSLWEVMWIDIKIKVVQTVKIDNRLLNWLGRSGFLVETDQRI